MSDSNETMAVSPRTPASSGDEPDHLEYLALKGARRDRHYTFMIKGQKAMEEGDYADAVIQFQQALNIMPTYQVVYGRTCALFSLDKPLDIPEKYQGGKSDSCFYHFCKAHSTLMCVCKQENISPYEFKLLIDDAWDDLFEAQQNSHRRLSVVGNCIRNLKQLLEDLDATSMNKKIKETKKIVKLLENFQPKLVSHVSTGYLCGSSSDSPPAPMKESEESAA